LAKTQFKAEGGREGRKLVFSLAPPVSKTNSPLHHLGKIGKERGKNTNGGLQRRADVGMSFCRRFVRPTFTYTPTDVVDDKKRG
jgi:hypothetical protein